jgi:hypothetical protein
LEIFLFKYPFDGGRDLLIYNIFDASSREDVLDQDVKLEHVVEGKLAYCVDPQCLN